MPIIELVDVSIRLGGRVVLDKVCLTVEKGETLALVGPSGGGKSTLLRCINGLVRFDAGSLRADNYELPPVSVQVPTSTLRAVREKFSLIFQDFQLFPHLTVIENVTEAPVFVRGVSKGEAGKTGMRLLERVGMADRASAFPRELSGGQKQRVAIARALAMDPVALLCDEITSALDPELKGEVLDVLSVLRRDGLTLVLVTHEIGFARRAADRVAVLSEGRIVETGGAREVLESPREERTRRFLDRVMV
jgi:ABC-type polar amino acid transport system ATPase subunit